jgi:hypothetical protein
MARKRKAAARWSRRAQLKIRLPEPVRLNLERAARGADRSMNAEIVWRLTESVSGSKDPYSIAAEAILNGLDQEIVTRIEDMILRANFTDEQLDRMLDERFRKAGWPMPPDDQRERSLVRELTAERLKELLKAELGREPNSAEITDAMTPGTPLARSLRAHLAAENKSPEPRQSKGGKP